MTETETPSSDRRTDKRRDRKERRHRDATILAPDRRDRRDRRSGSDRRKRRRDADKPEG